MQVILMVWMQNTSQRAAGSVKQRGLGFVCVGCACSAPYKLLSLSLLSLWPQQTAFVRCLNLKSRPILYGHLTHSFLHLPDHGVRRKHF